MSIFIEQTGERTPSSWDQINWHQVGTNVRRLQERIYRATERQDWKKVRSLQKLLVRATSNRLLAIRKVTQENQGRKTPGVDGQMYDTPEKRLRLSQERLDLTQYWPLPVRRVYIPKANGKKRPLGIATQRDRVIQSLVKAALEPEWEARFEANSYGFRPGRCAMDAITQIHITLHHETGSAWILDADISSCFDEIAHDPLLARIPVFDTLVRRWLKAGVVELGHYTDTETGVPQGGPLSPLLANIALDGMERLFGAETTTRQPITPSDRRGLNRGVSLIRYADDLVVIAPSREVLEIYVKPRLEQFLAERGLRLSTAKTQIVHRDEGFNFLGFTIRRYNKKLLTLPQPEKVQRMRQRIKAFLDANQQAKQENLVWGLNALIRGWANYYRYGASSAAYNDIADYCWQRLWFWAKRRHPHKGGRWLYSRYFRRVGQRKWVFGTERATLFDPRSIAITRHVKVRGRASPYDATLRAYWATRSKRAVQQQTSSWFNQKVLRAQDFHCGACGSLFQMDDKIEYHHRQPRARGGTDEADNLVALHGHCHLALHQRRG